MELVVLTRENVAAVIIAEKDVRYNSSQQEGLCFNSHRGNVHFQYLT